MFEWKDNYSLGIKDIDDQHKKLLKIGMGLYELMASKEIRQSDRYDEIIDMIHELKEYTVYHFNYEEQKLEKCNYSDLDKHILEHQNFIDKIDEVEDEDVDSFQNKVALELIDYIAKWIVNHILVTDRKYVKELTASL